MACCAMLAPCPSGSGVLPSFGLLLPLLLLPLLLLALQQPAPARAEGEGGEGG